jgi:Holliday junction resolvasome RuvABC DNA-binding subunit
VDFHAAGPEDVDEPSDPSEIRFIPNGDYEARARARAIGYRAAKRMWEEIQGRLADYASRIKWS